MPNQTTIPCYVETLPGLEEVTWIEIRRRFPQAQFIHFLFAKDERGLVVFDLPGAPAQLLELRTAETPFLRAAYLPDVSRGYRDLRELRAHLVDAGELGRAVNLFTRHRRRQPATYRIAVRSYGRHQYNPKDIWKMVVPAIESLYSEWERVQEGGDVVIWVNAFGSHLLAGIALPAPAKSAEEIIAAALVLMTDPDGAQIFLDPLCTNPHVLPDRAAFTSADQLLAAGDRDALATVRDRMRGDVTYLRWEDGELSLPDASVDRVATSFPGGEAVSQFGRWLGEIGRVLRPEGEAVLHTPEFDRLRDELRNHPPLQIRGGYSLTTGKSWSRIYILARE